MQIPGDGAARGEAGRPGQYGKPQGWAQASPCGYTSSTRAPAQAPGWGGPRLGFSQLFLTLFRIAQLRWELHRVGAELGHRQPRACEEGKGLRSLLLLPGP